MSQELATEKQTATIAKTVSGDLPWMRKFLPAHFFTEKVVANREAGFASVSAPRPKQQDWQPKTWQAVTRKMFRGRTTHIELHVKEDDRSFLFMCPCSGVPLHISRETLLTAVATVRGSEWVHVRAGNQTLCLSRLELRKAFNALEET